MSFALVTLRKDWQRMRRNPTELLLWLGIPLAIGSLIILASGGRDGPQPSAHVLIVDHDDTFLSGLLLGALAQGGQGLMQGEAVGEEEGRQRIYDGDATALLVIPSGFTDAVLLEEPTTLQLVLNPSEQILPGIVEESLQILVDATFYAHRLVGEDLREFANGPAAGSNTFPDTQIAEFSVKINRLVEDLQIYLSPMIIQLESALVQDKEPDDKPQPSIAMLFMPSILYMSLLFMCSGLAEDLWKERDQKTLRRVMSTPQSVAALLFGKLLWGAILMLCVSTVALTIGFLYFGMNLRVLPLGLLWTVFSGSLLLLLMIVLQIHASSKKTADILAMSVLFPLMMLGGNFFPLEAMPRWMAAVGKFTPNGWSMQQLKNILMDTIHPQQLALAFVGMAAFWALLFFINVRRIRGGFVRG